MHARDFLHIRRLFLEREQVARDRNPTNLSASPSQNTAARNSTAWSWRTLPGQS